MKNKKYLSLFLLLIFMQFLPNLLLTPDVNAQPPPEPEDSFRLETPTNIYPQLTDPKLYNYTDKYVYVTSYGNYTFKKSLPYLMSYTYIDGTELVKLSLFWLNTTLVTIPIPLNPIVLVANDTLFKVNVEVYRLLTKMGDLQITVKFYADKIPKISVLLIKNDNWNMGDFNINWWIITNGTYLKTNATHSFHIKDYASLTVTFTSVDKVELGNSPSPENWRAWSLNDWSDYGNCSVMAGNYTLLGNTGSWIRVIFNTNDLEIDPSTVGSTDIIDATSYPTQRKTFINTNDGRYWVWFNNGSYILAYTSTGGSSWSLATGGEVRSATSTAYFSIDWNDTSQKVGYVYSSGTDEQYLYYRRGTISGANITWDAVEQAISVGNTYTTFKYPSIATDTAGYPYISYYYEVWDSKDYFVNGFIDNRDPDWTLVGTSPYLSSVNYPTDYIYTSTDLTLSGDYDFADPGAPETGYNIVSVSVQLYCMESTATNNLIEVFMYDGTTWQTTPGTVNPGTTWTWQSISLTSFLDTWTKITNAKMYVRAYITTAATLYIDAAKLTVTFQRRNPYVVKSSTNDGTFVIATGFPYRLTTVDESYATITLKLSSGDMYVAYGYGGATIKGRAYISGVWQAEDTISTSTLSVSYGCSAIWDSNYNLHLVFRSGSNIIYVKRTTSWQTEVTIRTGQSTSAYPTITCESGINNLYVFYYATTDIIRIDAYYKGEWTIQSSDWYTESAGLQPKTLTSTLNINPSSNRIGLVWVAGTAVPYSVKYGVYSLPGNSTTNIATQYSHQRATFYASNKHWRFYSDGMNLVYQTSSDGSNFGFAYTVRPCTFGYYFSVWFNGTYVHYTYSDSSASSNPLYYRMGTPNSNSSITWSASEQIAVAGATNERYYYPVIVTDSDGYPWIGYCWYDGSVMYANVTKSANNNGVWLTATGFPKSISGFNTFYWYVTLVPLTGGKLYALYGEDWNWNNFWGRLYNGTDFEAEETPTLTDIQVGRVSAVALGDDVHVVFLKLTTYDIVYVRRYYSNSSWSSDYTVQAGTTSSSEPVITADQTNNELYVFWAGSPLANHIYYRRKTTTWQSVTDWITESALTGNNRLTSSYKDYSTKIGLVYMTSTASPYKIKYNSLTVQTNNAPTIGEFGAPSTVYAYQTFYINVTVNDINGKTDIYNVTIGFMNGNYSWNEDTNTWSTVTANSRINFLTGSCLNSSSNSTMWKLSFVFQIYWNGTDGLIDVWGKVFDGLGASATMTSSGLFTFESDLIIYSASSNDTRCNPSQGLNLTGWVFYEGTTLPPYTSSGLTVYVELSGVTKGSDTTLTGNGNFSVVFNAESSVSSYSYNVYTMTDEVSVQNKTVTVIVDRIKVYYELLDDSDNRTNINNAIEYRVKAVLEYDEHPLGSGDSLTANTGAMTWDATNLWFDVSRTESTVTSYTFQVTSGSEATYGITALTTNQTHPTGIWDKARIYYESLDDSRVDVNSNIEFRVKGLLLYDNHPLGSGDTVTANFGGLTWDSSNEWFDGSRTQSTVGNYTFTISSISEATYGITVFETNVTDPVGIWDRLKVESSGVTDGKINNGTSTTVYFVIKYEYDLTNVTDGVININGSSATYNSGLYRWELTVSNSSVTSHTYAVTSASGNTHGITVINHVASYPQVIWDWNKLQEFSYSSGTLLKVNLRAVSLYDGNLNNKSVQLRVYLGNSLWQTLTSTTDSNGLATFSFTKNLYGQGTLTFNLTNTDDGIDSGSYTTTFNIAISNYDSTSITLNKFLITQGETLVLTMSYKSVAKVNNTYIPLSNIWFKANIYYGDDSPYGSANFNLYNGTASNGFESHSESMVVTFPEGSYYINMTLYIRGSDYELGTAKSAIFQVQSAGTGPGGAGGGVGMANLQVLYVIVKDWKGELIKGAYVDIKDMYNGTVANMTTDIWGSATFSLIPETYHVIVTYKNSSLLKTVELKDEPETVEFYFPRERAIVQVTELLIDTQSIVIFAFAGVGVISAIILERKRYTGFAVLLSFISILIVIYGGLVMFRVMRPFFILPSITPPTLTLPSLPSLETLGSAVTTINTNQLFIILGLSVIGVMTAYAVHYYVTPKPRKRRRRRGRFIQPYEYRSRRSR